MDLSVLEPIDPVVARRRMGEYQAAVRERHSDEDAAIAAGYRAMAEGKTLISLSRTIGAGGLSEDQRLPRLAVGRSTAEWCYLSWSRHNWSHHEQGWDLRFSETPDPPRSAKHVVRRLRSMFPGEEMSDSWRNGGMAMVPPVPPGLRPARGLGRYHTLFEVPRWERAPRPPGDPALIRQVAGDLYVVVATWDLTELEQLVLSRRAPS